ncbi:secretin N-terminal domain-containing protein [Pseudomonas sp. N040]|uniref:secretin N-terminal domain-containing protein n=1 Tax=Pseudomonas sp. N040 TaxID=2785325 RepID=UPI0018A326D8|nr:secretin N-terminal domain-containing protein [Pseudomonas sp. N040]MBF7731497.1 secretin [Pseudomonas sp. N040]MBW7015141.1 secretin [Pseudomonas sp. N040]
MNLRTLCLLCLTTLSFGLQAATEVIPLNYVMANDVLPTAQAVLGNQGRANAYGNQLIVSAPVEKIAELRSVIEQLDTQPRRLLISLDTAGNDRQASRGYSVNGSASAGNVEIQAGHGEVNSRDQVRIINNNSVGNSASVQQVQATEGYPALIQAGQSVPLTTTSRGPYGQVYSNTEYRDVMRGFLVTATVAGERVNISIRSSNDSLSRSQPGTIEVQSTDTRVSGQLGEWIPLGGVSTQSQNQDAGFLRRYSSNGQDQMSMRIKVELAH